MAIVNKGKTHVMSLITAAMTFVLTFFGLRWDHGEATRHLATGQSKPADGFRIPLSMSSALATMHVSTIEHLTTVLRFKATIMNQSHLQINAMINKLNSEAKFARDRGDTKALLRSTKRLMVMNEALRDRIQTIESKPR